VGLKEATTTKTKKVYLQGLKTKQFFA